MAEIKTCEQYVLSELEKCQWDIDSLKAINAELDDQIGSLQEEVHLLNRYIDRLHNAFKNSTFLENPAQVQWTLYPEKNDIELIKNFIEHGLRRE